MPDATRMFVLEYIALLVRQHENRALEPGSLLTLTLSLALQALVPPETPNAVYVRALVALMIVTQTHRPMRDVLESLTSCQYVA